MFQGIGQVFARHFLNFRRAFALKHSSIVRSLKSHKPGFPNDEDFDRG